MQWVGIRTHTHTLLSDTRSEESNCNPQKNSTSILFYFFSSFPKEITFQWIPSHCGIPGNEEADTIAKQSSFSDLYVTSPMSQVILKPFRCFTYITAHSPTLPSLLLHHRHFTYVTWRTAHDLFPYLIQNCMPLLMCSLCFIHWVKLLTHESLHNLISINSG